MERRRGVESCPRQVRACHRHLRREGLGACVGCEQDRARCVHLRVVCNLHPCCLSKICVKFWGVKNASVGAILHLFFTVEFWRQRMKIFVIKEKASVSADFRCCRGSRIRTCDPLLPKQAVKSLQSVENQIFSVLRCDFA